MVFCPNCGTELDDSAKFCLECGIPLNKDKNLNSDKNLDNKDSLNEESNKIEKTSKIDEDNVDCANGEKEKEENDEISDDVEKKKNKHILNNKNKKYVVYGVIAIIEIIAITWVANELYYPTDSYTDEIDGLKFQIPAGYKLSTEIDTDDIDYKTVYVRGYKNSAGDYFQIKVDSPRAQYNKYQGQELTTVWSLNETNCTIKNNNGILQLSNPNNNQFTYIKDKKLVKISYSTQNLEDIIIE